jgi:hypothetical protein
MGSEVHSRLLAAGRRHPGARSVDGASCVSGRQQYVRRLRSALATARCPHTNRITKNFTPPLPAYPSGHATFGAAALHITRLFCGEGGRYSNNSLTTDNLFAGLDLVWDEFNGINSDNTGAPRPRHRRNFPGGLWQMIEETAAAASTSVSAGCSTPSSSPMTMNRTLDGLTTLSVWRRAPRSADRRGRLRLWQRAGSEQVHRVSTPGAGSPPGAAHGNIFQHVLALTLRTSFQGRPP